MGVVWVDSNCEDSSIGAHFFEGILRVDGGDVFKCKYCKKVKWLPGSIEGAVKLAAAIRKYGDDEGYRRFLGHFPKAKAALASRREN